MSLEPTLNLIDLLRGRAESLSAARTFFAKRKILEVDCGALVPSPPLDAHIDVMTVAVSELEIGYLHTSPEYAMKKLLSQGAPDLYFLGHVYRKGEIGRRHNPEFTMAEWYRAHFSFAEMIQETLDFITLFTGVKPVQFFSYREVFQRYLDIDSSTALLPTLLSIAKKEIDLPPEASSWKRETLLQLLLSHLIEPQFDPTQFTILADYPPHEAALACLVEKGGELVAERFEIYQGGLELANGYHELSDAQELRARFEKLNQERLQEEKDPYPLDEPLLASLESGAFPPCCGVSVGFDRVLMLKYQQNSLSQTIPFPWKKLFA